MEINQIYNIDCLKGLAEIPSNSVDLVLCDPPYGTMQGIDDRHEWDKMLDMEAVFAQLERIVKMNGNIILFSCEPFTTYLRSLKPLNINFLYPAVWVKNTVGNPLNAKHSLVSFYEDINIFRRYAPRHDYAIAHPLRHYAQKVLQYINKPIGAINKELGHRRAEHFFYIDTPQFSLCTLATYNELIKNYKINEMPDFMPYPELFKIDAEFTPPGAAPPPTFNLPYGKRTLSNVFQFKKDTDAFHPTQKPVALIQRLMETYSNPGDLVLDFTMGSGTTAVAAIRCNRNFIGFELNEEYHAQSLKRIEAEKQKARQLKLF